MIVTITNRTATLNPSKESIEQALFNFKTGEYIDSYYLTNNTNSFNEFNRFKYIYKSDETLWHEANIFLIDYIKKKPSLSLDRIKTYEKALREFISFCEPLDENGVRKVFIDYHKAEHENYAPTHRFRQYLIDNKVKTKKSETAVERLMPPICAFYEWMLDNGNKFDVPLWKENIVLRDGVERVSKDVCKYLYRKSGGEYVYDDGKLRPLSLYEERMILKGVNAIGNPEYRLIFFIALNSMARKQTILTLRIRNILSALPENVEQIPESVEDVDIWLRTITWPSDMADLICQH